MTEAVGPAIAAPLPPGRRRFGWIIAGAAGLALAASFAGFLGAVFPRLDLQLGVMLAIGLGLVVTNVAHQLRLGRRYALLNVYSGIFASEFIVGALVAVAAADVMNKRHLSTASVTAALALGLGGYMMLLIGYHLPSLLPGRFRRTAAVPASPAAAGVTPAAARDGADFPPRYRVLLFVFMAATIGFGFVQLLIRVQKAGGFANYLAIAYTMRYGTYADNDVANAWAVMASMFAAGALPSAALLFVAWMRRRLTTIEKWLLLGLTIALLARQASTAFRAVVVFTLISAFAVYDSERRVSWQRLTVWGLLILLVLIGVNYAHVMLHTLTGMGTTTSFADATEDLLAPHAYVETLTGFMEARERLDALAGSGMLTSILFFIPRAIWTTKVPSEEYGTGLVQAWAGMPTWYQMAPTNVGELFVHFGAAGILTLFFWGLIYRWLDDRWEVGLEWRVALLCISVPRVFPDQGMGLSAFMISIMSLACFIVPLLVARRMLGLRGHTPATPA